MNGNDRRLRDHTRQQLHVEAIQKSPEYLRGEMTIGIARLVEVIHLVRATLADSGEFRATAQLLQPLRIGQATHHGTADETGDGHGGNSYGVKPPAVSEAEIT